MIGEGWLDSATASASEDEPNYPVATFQAVMAVAEAVVSMADSLANPKVTVTQNAGACDSLGPLHAESKIAELYGRRHICEFLDNHTGVCRSKTDGFVRWKKGDAAWQTTR